MGGPDQGIKKWAGRLRKEWVGSSGPFWYAVRVGYFCIISVLLNGLLIGL